MTLVDKQRDERLLRAVHHNRVAALAVIALNLVVDGVAHDRRDAAARHRHGNVFAVVAQHEREFVDDARVLRREFDGRAWRVVIVDVIAQRLQRGTTRLLGTRRAAALVVRVLDRRHASVIIYRGIYSGVVGVGGGVVVVGVLTVVGRLGGRWCTRRITVVCRLTGVGRDSLTLIRSKQIYFNFTQH